MIGILITAGAALIISFFADPKKTARALKAALKKFIALLPSFLTMLAAVSIVLTLIPEKTIVRVLGEEDLLGGTIIAALFGSITFMPGFIVFPLAGILLTKGVAYTVLAGFTTTLMMVGVLTYPIEKEYFGIKVTVIRNCLSFVIAIIIAVIIGISFGEIGL